MSLLHRRDFFKTAGLAGAALAPQVAAAAPAMTEKEKLSRIASNTWPIRQIFKTRAGGGGGFGPGQSNVFADMKKKDGEITMVDFPQWTKDNFPGVTKMDLFSGLFGDTTDETMYTQIPMGTGANGQVRMSREFDPSSESGKRWLGKMADKMKATGTTCQHISNNAPRDICDPDPEKRKAGIAVAKKWLDAGKILGAKSMRVNSGGPRILPLPSTQADGYPKSDDIAVLLKNAIESFKEM